MLQTTWPQRPVASENVAVCFTPEPVGQSGLCTEGLVQEKVTREDYTDVASLVSPSPRPDLVSQLERGGSGDPNPWEAEVLRASVQVASPASKTEELAVGPYECKEPGEGLCVPPP